MINDHPCHDCGIGYRSGHGGGWGGGSPKWEDDMPICVPKWEEKKMTHTPPVRDMSLSGVTNL